jgi:hypothetical protein
MRGRVLTICSIGSGSVLREPTGRCRSLSFLFLRPDLFLLLPQKRMRWGMKAISCKNNLPKKSDVVAQPIKPGIRIPNRDVNLDARKKIVERCVGKSICPGLKWIRSPYIHGKAAIDGLALVID